MRTFIFLVCLALAGCTGGQRSDPEAQDTLAAHRQAWADAGLDDYTYSFKQDCFCVLEQVQPVTIEVRDGRIARVVSAESGEDITGNTNLRWYTVSELFGLIEEAGMNGWEPLIVEYDAELGYPTRIEIGSLAADAGVIYTASGLRPL